MKQRHLAMGISHQIVHQIPQFPVVLQIVCLSKMFNHA